MDQTVYAQRRERVLERLGGGVLVLSGAKELRRNGDSEFPFRQESDLLYLTGFPEPNAVLVLNPNIEKRFTLFVPPRDKDAEIWTGRRAGVEGAVQEYGADQAFVIADFEKELPRLLSNAHTLYCTLGLDAERDRQLIHQMVRLRDRPPAGKAVPEKIADLGGLLHELRLVKGPEEIAALRTAAALTDRGFRRALAATRPGLHEYEIEAELLYEFRKGGGEGPGYVPIVASGANATVLHYPTGRDVLRDGDLLLVDCGCEWMGYTADVTRTWPVNGRFSPPQRRLYELVLAAHDDAIAATRSGMARDGIHEIATRRLIAGLIELGLLTGSREESWEKKTYRKYFMHSTGHWLGLDVHDAGSFSAGGTSRPLAPGFVITVEPGLYVASDDESAPPEYRGLGIRIEDDVLVTEHGCEVLTKEIPITVDELERTIVEGRAP